MRIMTVCSVSLACVLSVGGCASRKIVVTELDKAVNAVQQSMILAQCHGVKLQKGATAEFFAKTAYNLNLGAPAGATG